jgi:uncharacterized membrane protein
VTVVGVVLARYPALPDRVATHYNLAGQADGWGPKFWTLVMAGVFAVLIEGTSWLARRPQWFNYPCEITADRAQAAYREAERTMVWLNAALLALFAGMAAVLLGWASTVALIPGMAGLLVVPAVGILRTVRALN